MTEQSLFKWRPFETDIILLCVRWYLCYALSYRDLEEIMRERGWQADHTTISRWVQHYAPELEKRCRLHLRRTTDSWRVDETYVKIKGVWIYHYRAGESQGNTLEFLLSATRDAQAAKRFFVKAFDASYTVTPRVITVDKYEENWFELNPEFLLQTTRTIRTLRCHNGAHIELFEFSAPDQQKQMPRNIDYGGHHVAFYVDDMEEAITYLEDKGVKLFGEKKSASGPEAGKDSTFIHFRTPCGVNAILGHWDTQGIELAIDAQNAKGVFTDVNCT